MIILRIYFFILFAFLEIIFAQSYEKLTGKVTYISSQYVYIRFESTEGINFFDTLYDYSNLPSAIVNFISSSSVAAKPLKLLHVDDLIFAKVINLDKLKINQHDSLLLSDSSLQLETQFNKSTWTNEFEVKPKSYQLKISGQMYGDLNDLDKSTRYRYTFNYNNSKFLGEHTSFESYLIFNINHKKTPASAKLQDYLKVYQLEIETRLNENNLIKVGRSLNNYLYSMGSIDGIQYQINSGNTILGLILGSRPDYMTYWYNFKLLQAGIFINRSDSIFSSQMENTIGFIEQTNKLKPDRRYVYFQHRNNILPFTNLFFSSEIDFFQVSKGIVSKKINLTSLYSLVNIRFHRNFGFNISYDSRKNVYFLESFKNTIDTLLENELRQGFRISAFLRPINILFLNLFYSQRETAKDKNASDNYGITIGSNLLPLINTSLSLNFNQYNTSFIKGNNYSIYASKNILDNLMLTTNFRLYEFNNVQVGRLIIDRFLEFGIFWNVIKSLSFSMNYEQKLNNEKSKYLMLDLTTRF